jgi:hypothetical protein
MQRAITLASATLITLAACGGKKQVEPSAPIVGWHAEETWGGSCYFPPSYEELELTERRMARQEALQAMMSQWRGERGDGMMVDTRIIEDVETTLLGYPDEIEGVSRQNLEYCKSFMGVGGESSSWIGWLRNLPEQLMAGECVNPLRDTRFDYLDIGRGWQFELPVCSGDVVKISATVKDRYRVTEKGEWINVEGDMSQPASAGDLPCNLEGCYVGQLIARFVSEDGVESIFPVGAEKVWTAPAHGTISVAINDITYYDNTWYQSGTIIDHTSLEIGPAE